MITASVLKGLSNPRQILLLILTLQDPFVFESCIEIKIELNFYFHTLLCL